MLVERLLSLYEASWMVVEVAVFHINVSALLVRELLHLCWH